MGELILIFSIAYLAGSINFAIIFFKLAGKADPRLSFSGNAGTTNVYRQAGIIGAIIVFLLDMGRAIAVAFCAVYWLPVDFIPWAGFFLVLGNSYPCFHGFSGGKGVANYLGFSLFVAPWSAFFAAVIWLAAYGVYRIPFVASIFMIFALAIGQAYLFHWTFSPLISITATFLLILFNHRVNIISYWKINQPVAPNE